MDDRAVGAGSRGASGRSILILSHVVPHPPNTGVHVRTYNTWTALSTDFALSALCFHRREGGRLGGDPEQARAALRGVVDFDSFSLPQDRSRLRLLGDHLESLARRRVYTVPTYRDPAFRVALCDALARRDFDLVQLETLDLSYYLGFLSGQKVVCTHHNIESDLLVRRARLEPNPLLRAYMRAQARLMRREERRWGRAVDLNVVVSDRDRDRLLEISPGARVAVVPNGVDTDYFVPRDGPESGIVFTGGTMYQPNRDALEFFASAILPRIREQEPSLDVSWVGRATDAEKLEFSGKGVLLTGLVESVRPHLARAACFVAPLRSGGGTRLKILEAWAMGKAVVSTRVGCEGLDAVDGENILIRDDPRAFAEAVLAVVGDEALRRRLGAAGRVLAEQRYAWREIGRRMRAHYAELLD